MKRQKTHLHSRLVSRVLFIRYVFFVSVFSFFCQGLFAQKQPDKKTIRYFEQAESAYQSNHYLQTEFYLTKLLKHDPFFVKAYLLRGDVYAIQHRLKKAVLTYRRGLSLDSVSYPAAYFVLGGWEYKTGDYVAAVRDIRYYLKLGKDKPSIGKVDKLLKNALFAEYAVAHPQKIMVKQLNARINSPADEYINFVDAEGKQLFFTRKIPEKKNGKTVYTEHFFSSVKAGKTWQRPKKIHFSWDSTLNMGAMSLSVDGRVMYFTGCYWPGGFGRCDIYVSRKLGNHWQFPRHLDRNVNTPYWDSQAVVSPDGKRLFFASKRPGGKGGSDIWMCIKQNNGFWGKAIDLGDSINTPGNEMAPFLHADGRTLYFSSDGHTGLGGYDLYVSHYNNGHWSKAVNLGYPINTKANEINLFVSVDGRRAWLSSDRNTGNYNIYSFPLYDGVRPGRVLFVKGVVTDAHTGKKLSAKVVLTNLSTGRPVDSVVSDPVSGQFLVVLHAGTDYAFHIFKKGYLMYSQHFDLKTFPQLTSINKNFALEPVSKGNVMRLHNILFDFDRATLRTSAFPELNRLVRFLKENPGIDVLIAGYTDNIGSKAYNLKLSRARAKAVFDYLVSKGIAAGRMTYQGFGSSHPVAGNQTAEGRAANRRTEIVIK